MTFDPTVPITRVEVIDDEGRQFVRWDIPKVELSFQDGGRTLKVFLKGSEKTMAEKYPSL